MLEGALGPVPLAEVELPDSVRLPPVPATEVGLTFLWAFIEAFLYAANVLGPERLDSLSAMRVMIPNTRDLRRVDDTDHTSLAMHALSAVEPDRSRSVLDLVGEGPVRDLLSGGSGDETRPETVVRGRAWLSKGTLGNGVVLGPEAESNGVTLSSGNGLGNEDKTTSLVGDRDEVVFCNSGADKGGSSKD